MIFMSGMMHSSPPRLNAIQAKTLIDTAKRISGVSISTDKIAFLELRINRRLRDLGCPDFESYITLLKGPGGAAEANHVAEALTTHTTSFFRERAHYDWLESEGIRAIMDRGAGLEHKLTVWSAACSLGSEMWSAAILLDRYSKKVPGGLMWEVVGTDISRQILRQAANAVFHDDQISGLPEELRRAYLMRSRSSPPLYRIVPELRNRARLFWANLVDMDPKFKVMADVAFLRNVLIYFEPEDQRRAVVNVVSRIRLGGYLLTGHSERLSDLPANLRQIAASTYQKV